MRFPIRISGSDLDGNPFSQDAETVDISRSGARIRWVTSVRKGQNISVQHGREKADFRVIWLGQAGSPYDGEVGLRCAEKRYIWGTTLPVDGVDDFVVPAQGAESSSPPPVSPGIELTAPWSGEERRVAPRYPCSGNVELTPKGSNLLTRGGLSDLSRGGCYVEIMTPFPYGTEVRLTLEVGEETIAGEAVVRSSHPSVGMGLQFTHLEEAGRARREAVLARLAGRGEAAFEPAPEVARSASVGTTSQEVPALLQALLEVLEAKGVVTRSEIEQALEKARARSGS
jgi:hypothetical protein